MRWRPGLQGAVALAGDRRWLRAAAVSCEQPRRESAGVKVPSYLSGLAVFLLSPTHMPDTLWGHVGPLLPPHHHHPPPPPALLKENAVLFLTAVRGAREPQSFICVGMGGRGGTQLCPQAPRIPESHFRRRPSTPANTRSPGVSLLPGCGSLLGPCP